MCGKVSVNEIAKLQEDNDEEEEEEVAAVTVVVTYILFIRFLHSVSSSLIGIVTVVAARWMGT